MLDGARHDRPAGRRGPREGFTLVELLLVMFVMSVLVALVVGVGRYVIRQGREQETLGNQDRLIAAVDAFRKVLGKYPMHDPNGTGRIDYLMEQLNGDANTLQLAFRDMSFSEDLREEIREATESYLGLGGEGSVFESDAWGHEMLYYRDRGAGGKPLIISAGPDGDFGEEVEEKRADNIRSDSRE